CRNCSVRRLGKRSDCALRNLAVAEAQTGVSGADFRGPFPSARNSLATPFPGCGIRCDSALKLSQRCAQPFRDAAKPFRDGIVFTFWLHPTMWTGARFWSAPAERSGDGALDFRRAVV